MIFLPHLPFVPQAVQHSVADCDKSGGTEYCGSTAGAFDGRA